MKLLPLIFILTSCYLQQDFNTYGVVREKKIKSGISIYTIEINPTHKLKYQSLDTLSVGDTVLIKSFIVK